MKVLAIYLHVASLCHIILYTIFIVTYLYDVDTVFKLPPNA